MMSRSRRAGASVMALLWMAGGVAAEENSTAVLPKVRVWAQEDIGYYAPHSAAATKTDTLLRDVPQSVSIVTRQQLDDQNAQNIGEAMVYVPGVTMAQGEGNRETPVIRGNSSTGDFFLDGMRDDVQYYRDLYNIERVEAFKGPNGMIFGRGGIGGLINRVSKEAGWTPARTFSVQAGSHENKRTALDLGGVFDEGAAYRLNAMYEDSESYRDDVSLKRYGFNPTLTVRAGAHTKLVLGAEYFHDERVADRGVSSFQGRPLEVHPSTFFGDPAQSPTDTTVKMANMLIERRLGETLTLRNRTRYADYDKFYQNVFPGAVGGGGTTVSISAYNNAMQRENVFNQTDLTFTVDGGLLRHSLLAGLELGRQETTNFRNTGFFDSVAFGTTSVDVPLSNPRTTLPVTFRQNATDADNAGTAKIAAFYLQDEIAFGARLRVLLGLRYDQFEVDFTNNRTGARFSTDDDLLSPRMGLVYKPLAALSLYAGYSKTFQPRAGDQLSSLTLTTQALDPEEFENYEIGLKWDLAPELAFTAAVYRLERDKVAINDPSDPSNPPRLILVDGQRTQGVELALSGRVSEHWNVVGAYAYQDGEIERDQSATVLEGATLANLPEHTFSLWNRYDLTPQWGFGLGLIHREEWLAAVENLATPASNVTLPSYTRVDVAVFFTLSPRLRAQLNVENVLGEDYFLFAHNNTNITPGAPRSARVSVTTSF